MDDSRVTIEDILSDLKESLKRTPEDATPGLTADEFADALGIGNKKAAKLLKKLVKSGRLAVRSQEITDVTGRKNYTFVYYPK